MPTQGAAVVFTQFETIILIFASFFQISSHGGGGEAEAAPPAGAGGTAGPPPGRAAAGRRAGPSSAEPALWALGGHAAAPRCPIRAPGRPRLPGRDAGDGH